MSNRLLRFSLSFILVAFLTTAFQVHAFGLAEEECDSLGWFPAEFGLKDHSVFRFGETYYLVSTVLPEESSFAYARSKDLCHWEVLEPILKDRVPHTWDEQRVWAPSVYEEDGLYYLYYTGVTDETTQSILAAVSSDPSDPTSWKPQRTLFQPNHPGMVWTKGGWADCRDPFVTKVGDRYYLLYTGRDEAGGMIGLAVASSPLGPWDDQGSILTLSGPDRSAQVMPESPGVLQHEGVFYLYYHDTEWGEQVSTSRASADKPLSGPWSPPRSLRPGWAFEFWPGAEGKTYASYLTDYSVSISPVSWDTYYTPPQPYLGEAIHHLRLPLLRGPLLRGGQAHPK